MEPELQNLTQPPAQAAPPIQAAAPIQAKPPQKAAAPVQAAPPIVTNEEKTLVKEESKNDTTSNNLEIPKGHFALDALNASFEAPKSSEKDVVSK